MRVAVVGGSGFTGAELLRLLSLHPKFELAAATSRSLEGERVDETFPNLCTGLRFVDPGDLPDVDIYFTAVPHTAAMEHVPALLDRGKVVDLSADYRLPEEVYERWYGVEHVEPLDAVYGLTELHRGEIRGADLVANPGCYPTGAVLAAAPLFEGDYVERAVFDSKSGVSGAGASPSRKKMYARVSENVRPYSLTAHRHLAEMRQELGSGVHFTPHVVPAVRGIETTAHLFLEGDPGDVEGLYRDFYGGDLFVKITGGVPEPRDVRGSNFVHVGGFDGADGRLVVVSAIDNLVKGASGAAIQNANLMAGLPEETGLRAPGMAP